MRPHTTERTGQDRHVRALGALAGGTLVALAAVLALGGGTASAVPQAAPKNTAEPVVSGTPRTGSTLSATRGSWSGSPTGYDYQWVRCGSDGGEPDGSDCASVGGATTSKYVLGGSDVGRRMRVRVTATNADGSATAASNATAVVASANAPVNTRRPTISGRAELGQQLRVEPGRWSGSQPITYAYQWLRCDSGGNNCVTQPGFDDDNYTVREGDIGKRLRVRVTATNGSGSSSTLTSATSVVSAPSGPPGAIKLPSGETSIPVTSVPATERLIVDAVRFEPNVVQSLDTTISIRVKVKDTRGYVVRDVIVLIRSTPVVTSAAPETKTATDGTVSFAVRPESDFPLRNDYNVQFFVKAYRQGDNPLGGVAGYRLVQVATAKP
jgi:hypothetical protein